MRQLPRSRRFRRRRPSRFHGGGRHRPTWLRGNTRRYSPTGVFARQLAGVVTLEIDGSTEADGTAGGCCERNRERRCKLPAREWNHVEILSVAVERWPDTGSELMQVG